MLFLTSHLMNQQFVGTRWSSCPIPSHYLYSEVQTHPGSLVPSVFLNSNYLQTLEKVVKCCLSQQHTAFARHCSSPSQWRLNMNTYMNIWIADQVVIVIHLHTLLPSLHSLLSGACSCAEHGLSDTVWSGPEGHKSTGVTEWLFLLRKNDLCLRVPPLSVCWASCYGPMPSFFSRYHAGIKSCHLPRWWTAGVPPHFLCQWNAAPWVCLRCSFGPYARWAEN